MVLWLMKILVVDDDPIVLDICKSFLENIGYEDVHLAQDAGEALRLIDGSRALFDCFLLDINMPEKSGIELIADIRGRAGYEFAPIIMSTAQESPQYIAEAFAAGALDYLVKPFEIFDLETRMHALEMHSFEIAQWHRNRDGVVSSNDNLTKHIEMTKQRSGAQKLGDGGLVSPIAFENCLLQMEPSSGRKLNVVALQIEDMDAIVARLTPARQVAYLTEVAEALVAEVAAVKGLVCHKGRGLFLFLSYMDLPDLNGMVHRDLADAFLELDRDYLLSFGLRTKLTFGLASYAEQPKDTWPLHLIENAIDRLAG